VNSNSDLYANISVQATVRKIQRSTTEAEIKELKTTENSSSKRAKDLQRQTRSREERKTAISVAIVIIVFIFLVYPRISLIIYHFFYPQTHTTSVVRLWSRVLMYINSAVNPVLYAWRMHELRKALKNMAKCGN
jgi:cation transport ATPase